MQRLRIPHAAVVMIISLGTPTRGAMKPVDNRPIKLPPFKITNWTGKRLVKIR